MRIFISWSGERSGHIAKGLKRWLTDVLHALDPWVSFEDIEKGARWNYELAQGLEKTSVGIICLTAENLTSPWILFESGALAKRIESSHVCTYLYQLRPTDVQGPLASFQATEATKPDTLRLIKMLNGLLGVHARSEVDLDRAFEKWWPELEQVLHAVPPHRTSTHEQRSDRGLLEEILTVIRRQERMLSQRDSIGDSASSLEFLLRPDEKEVATLVAALRRPDERIGSLQPVADASLLLGESLDGHWTSEWTGGGAGIGVRKGATKLTFHSDWVVGIEAESGRSPVFLVARRRGDGIFVGGSVNLTTSRYSSIWVGQIISRRRIRGQWKLGRWDFVRTLSEGAAPPDVEPHKT